MQNKLILVTILIFFIYTIVFAGLFLKTNAELTETKIRLDNAIRFPAAISQTRLAVTIHYNKEWCIARKTSTYDDRIDVGNEEISRALTRAILTKRENEPDYSQVPIQVEINERDGVAHIRIHWPESVQIFSIKLEDRQSSKILLIQKLGIV